MQRAADFTRGIRWNLLGLPLRAALSLAIGALIARLLTQSGAEALAAYGILLASAAACATWVHLGMSPILTRRLAELVADGNRASAVSLWRWSFLLRVPLVLVTALLVAWFAARSDALPTREAQLGAYAAAGFIVLRALLRDLRTHAEAFLNATVSRREANLATILHGVTQLALLAACLAVGVGELIYGAGCALLAGAAETFQFVRYAGRAADGPGSPDLGPRETIRFWRRELRSCAALHADKFIGFAISPHALLLGGSAVLGAPELALAYVALDFAQRASALVVAPFSGMLIPLFTTQQATRGPSSSRGVGIEHIALLAQCGALGAAAATALGFRLLYGDTLAGQLGWIPPVAGLLCLDAAVSAAKTASVVASGRLQAVPRSRLIGAGLGLAVALVRPPATTLEFVLLFTLMRVTCTASLIALSANRNERSAWRRALGIMLPGWVLAGVWSLVSGSTRALSAADAVFWLALTSVYLAAYRYVTPRTFHDVLETARGLAGRRTRSSE